MKNKIYFVKDETTVYSIFGEPLAVLCDNEKITVLNVLHNALQIGVGYYQGDFFEVGFIKPDDLKTEYKHD